MHISNKYRFVKSKPMQTFWETVPSRKVFVYLKCTYHLRRWCISALFRKKRLPLEGKLATKLTDEVFKETNAMRSSDPQKLMLLDIHLIRLRLRCATFPSRGRLFLKTAL